MKKRAFYSKEADETRINNLKQKESRTFTAIMREALKLLHRKEIENVSKILCIVALCISAISCGGQVLEQPPENDPAPPPPVTGNPGQVPIYRSGVVFVGDSIFGRLTQESAFINSGYANAGVFGQRTDEILARFPAILSGQSVCNGYIAPDGIGAPDSTYTCTTMTPPPATVVILAGWNNMFQGPPYISEMVPNLQSMIALAQQSGVRVIVCTVYAFDPAHPASWMVPPVPVTFYDMWRNPLNASIRQMQGATIVDLDAVFRGQIGYTADGVHPTFGAGNIQMLNAIMLSIQR